MKRLLEEILKEDIEKGLEGKPIQRKKKTNPNDFDIRLMSEWAYTTKAWEKGIVENFLADITAETEKAVLINDMWWIPKSQMKYVGEIEEYPAYVIPDWLWRAKKL